MLKKVIQRYAVAFGMAAAMFAAGAGGIQRANAAEIADQVLVTEDKDSEAAKQYANIVAVREGDENREDIKALVEALQSDEVKAYIEETFGSTVIPVF